MMHRTAVAITAALVLVAGTTACNRSDRDAATVSQGEIERTPLRVTDLALGRAVGTDKNITDATDDFRPNDTIYAVVKTSGNTPGALVARWTYQDGQVVDETTQNLSPAGDASTEFHIAKPDGFPKGNYKVEILMGGQVAESEEFQVQ
jgi:hypothetical protein